MIFCKHKYLKDTDYFSGTELDESVKLAVKNAAIPNPFEEIF